MKKNLRRKPSKKLLIWLLVFLVVAALIAFFIIRNSQDNQQNNALAPGHSSKQDVIDKNIDTQDPGEGLPDDSTSTTSDDVPTSPQLSTAIADFSQSEGMIKASASTSGSGTCVFLFQPSDGGKPLSRQVTVAGKTCSVAISQNEFALLGEWTLTVTYYGGGQKAEASRNVTIN